MQPRENRLHVNSTGWSFLKNLFCLECIFFCVKAGNSHCWLYITQSANTSRSPNVLFMLVYRLRRWPNIKTTLVERLLFAGQWLLHYVNGTTSSLSGCCSRSSECCAMSVWDIVILKSRKAVSAHLRSKQIPPFGFALRSSPADSWTRTVLSH